MRIIFLSLASFFLLSGCMERMMQEELAAEHNMINWQRLEIGMNENQVLNAMSFPDRKEFHVVDGREYAVWFYLTNTTKPVFVKKFSKKNYSPVVFRNGVLIGWGYDFYNYVFDVKQEKRKMEEENRMKYTDHPEEWPAKEHRIVPAPSKKDETKKKGIEKTLKEKKKTQSTHPQCEKQDKDLDKKNYNWWE